MAGLAGIMEANGINAVVIYSLDRLSRDMLTLLSLERFLNEYGIELHTVEGLIDTSTPDGFMSFAMKSFMGEMERRQVADRTRRAMAYKKINGEVVGQIPFGFSRDGDKLTENVEEMAIKARANELYEAGEKVSHIVEILNSEGVRTRSNRMWAPQQVERLIDGYKSVYKRHSRAGEAIKRFILAIA